MKGVLEYVECVEWVECVEFVEYVECEENCMESGSGIWRCWLSSTG